MRRMLEGREGKGVGRCRLLCHMVFEYQQIELTGPGKAAEATGLKVRNDSQVLETKWEAMSDVHG